MGEKLNKMIQYTKTKKCLEATLVHYFEPNEKLEECGRCSNCVNENKTYDMTDEAKNHQLYCPYASARNLRRDNSSAEREISDYVKYNQYDELSTFGIMKAYTTSECSHLIDELRFKGFLNENDEVLTCDKKGSVKRRFKIYTVPFKRKAKEK